MENDEFWPSVSCFPRSTSPSFPTLSPVSQSQLCSISTFRQNCRLCICTENLRRAGLSFNIGPKSHFNGSKYLLIIEKSWNTPPRDAFLVPLLCLGPSLMLLQQDWSFPTWKSDWRYILIRSLWCDVMWPATQRAKNCVATQRATPGECPLCHKLDLLGLKKPQLKKQVDCLSRSGLLCLLYQLEDCLSRFGRAVWRPLFGADGFAEVEQWGILNFPEQQRASVWRPSSGYFWKLRWKDFNIRN